jgi:sulfite dehydrogenase
MKCDRCHFLSAYFAATLRLLALAVFLFMGLRGFALEIQLPPETATFKQDAGAEIANGQCLTCHSVEYVVMQPPMPRAFWKSSVQKMQQKYGATIPEEQVEPVVDYLTRNYGITTNGAAAPTVAGKTNSPAVTFDGPALATRFGCFGCHQTTFKIVGPSYRDIAAKYKADADASQKIHQQIRQGGSGKWGPIIMPPFPQVSPGEIKVLTDWILSQK